jgi:aldehyde:ferredoxin oxidoreductase
MGLGFWGKILRVNLTKNEISVDEPSEVFFRTYYGGRNFIAYYLLKEVKKGIDPLGEKNSLIFAPGILTGTNIPGSARNSIGAKSPLTGLYGEAEVGGYWGAEFKRTGYDALIVEGRSIKPVYLWINDGTAEIRSAATLWGKTTYDSQELIKKELGDERVRVAQIGPGGENKVKYACIMNDLRDAAGRTGLGAVMGSKNLKAVAVRGKKTMDLADRERIISINKWLGANVLDLCKSLHEVGTGGIIPTINEIGAFPTRNYKEGRFSAADRLSPYTWKKEGLLIGMEGCYACPVRCKKVVRVEGPFAVNAAYGGPEFETIAGFGSNCGIDNPEIICKANEMCNALGIDTISTGSAVSFCMECFESGLITREDTDGLEMRFGNGEALLAIIEKIGKREGIGNLLAEGVWRASEIWGDKSKPFAMHIKGQEIPFHDPRWKHGLALGYAVSPTGAEHCCTLHDTSFSSETREMREVRALGILDPLHIHDLSPAKVRLFNYIVHTRSLMNCLVFCQFVPFGFDQLADLVQGVTGWNASVWELLKVGERGRNLIQAFNIREGIEREVDFLPQRFFEPYPDGLPGKVVPLDPTGMLNSIELYYDMLGWNPKTGIPGAGKLEELGLGWVKELLQRDEGI